MQFKPLHKFLVFIGLVFLGIIIYNLLDSNNILLTIQDGKYLQSYVESLGLFGPIVIVLLLMVAILVSPLPSAPIAIAAGAVYGHTWGTIYVLLGSISGSSTAFIISRYLGYDFLNKYFQDYFPKKYINSQNTLMSVVFVSRLMPFLSFDVISYAAGLTSLTFWRFVVATIFGILPASFFLAHVGSEIATVEINRIVIALLMLGLLTVISLIIRVRHNKEKSKNLP